MWAVINCADVLVELVELIEVTRLRGESVNDSGYMQWKAMQTRADQALVRFSNPKDMVIPAFDDIDLDI